MTNNSDIANNTTNVITANNLSHTFQQSDKDNKNSSPQILKNVSLQLAAGEVLAIMGPSGSGKSTLMHLLSGLERPSSGEIWWATQRIDLLNTQQRSALRAAQVGLVFQHHYLLEDLTVLENVLVPQLISGKSTSQTTQALELLQKVGMAERADNYPKVLSGGERQRVAIARALAAQPLMLLADEPTGSLDRSNSQAVTKLLVSVARQEKAGVLLVTHDDHVASQADRILFLVDGVLQLQQ